MEEGSMTPQLEYVPNELIHHIQSLLPANDAARTCVLSKSWLRAWSTIPTLRFTICVTDDHLTEEEETDYIKLIDRTLLRYLNDNMSIECFHLHLDIYNSSLSSLAENWFRSLVFRNCLKEFSLTICRKKLTWCDKIPSLTISAEIFSCENLNTINLIVDDNIITGVTVNMNHVMIKCLFLRVLELVNVRITSEEALNNLFSSCVLLEKISIHLRQDIKFITIQNLRYLRELRIRLVAANINDIVEIDEVPILRVFHYSALPKYTFKMDPLGSVRELNLLRNDVDDAFIDMINSKYPFLESLTLTMLQCRLEIITITCDSLKILNLELCKDDQISIKVYSSKLLYFSFNGQKMPTLLFPTLTPEHITLTLKFCYFNGIDLSFFLKMREALYLSSSFNIEIIDFCVAVNTDLDDLRRRVPSFPTRNVHKLSFTRDYDIDMWKHSTLFDIFFSICYPRYINAHYWPLEHRWRVRSKNYLYTQNVRQMIKKKRPDLKDVEIKNPRNGKWESLANYHRSFDEEASDYSADEFKLNWSFLKQLN